MQTKILTLLLALTLIATANADCTTIINENSDDEVYGSASAYAIIGTSRIYGKDCSDNPYHEYAEIKVRCFGTQLYLLEADKNADWDNINFNCGFGGCQNYDRKWNPGTHTINIQDTYGEMKSYWFACYDMDQASNGDWAWVWIGWGYWGTREIIPEPTSDCSPGQQWCIDTNGNGIKDAYKTCEDANGDGLYTWIESPTTGCEEECQQNENTAQCITNNQAPTAQPTLQETTITGGKTAITLIKNYQDPDGDPEGNSGINWYVNNQYTQNGQTQLTNDNYEYQDNIKVEYTPCDNQGLCGGQTIRTITASIQCVTSQQCTGNCNGHWECNNNQCNCEPTPPPPPECTQHTDCTGNCNGNWECTQNECICIPDPTPKPEDHTTTIILLTTIIIILAILFYRETKHKK